MYILPSVNNIFIPELVQQIAVHLPWSSLAYFTDLPDPGPAVVKQELRHRVLEHLTRFIPHKHTEDFWLHLESAGAVITGSFVRRLMQEGEDGRRMFKGPETNLNIVVSRYKDEPITSCLREYGFCRVESTVAGPFKAVSHCFSRFYQVDDEAGLVRNSAFTVPVVMQY
jgi:hypothetical protein